MKFFLKSRNYKGVRRVLEMANKISPHSSRRRDWGTPLRLRGGSWNNNGRNCRSANRNNNEPDARNNNNGFRVVVGALTPDCQGRWKRFHRENNQGAQSVFQRSERSLPKIKRA